MGGRRPTQGEEWWPPYWWERLGGVGVGVGIGGVLSEVMGGGRWEMLEVEVEVEVEVLPCALGRHFVGVGTETETDPVEVVAVVWLMIPSCR